MQTLHVRSQIVEKVETDLTLKEMAEFSIDMRYNTNSFAKSAQSSLSLTRKRILGEDTCL